MKLIQPHSPERMGPGESSRKIRPSATGPQKVISASHAAALAMKGKIASALKAGFSLVELLVGIAVISALMLVIMGAVGRLQEQKVTLGCISNLRQIGVLFFAYAGDNRGELDFHSYTTPGSTKRWSDFLENRGYLRKLDPISRCPLPPPFRNEPGHGYGGLGQGSSTDPFSRLMAPNSVSRVINLKTIDQPSRYWLLSDSWSTAHNDQIYVVEGSRSAQWKAQLRHQNRVNLLFADGRVQALKADELKSLPYNPLPSAFDKGAISVY